MTPKVAHIETLCKPSEYSSAQIAIAFAVHEILGRGKLILAEPPWGWR